VGIEYVVTASHREGMHFETEIGAHTVQLDYPLAPGADGAGPRPLEMLLASLACCAGGTLVFLFRRSGQSFESLRVTARGRRRTEHPMAFTEIRLEFALRGELSLAAAEAAVREAEERFCPVWAMLRPATPIEATVRIDA
jgi:putative redox protein